MRGDSRLPGSWNRNVTFESTVSIVSFLARRLERLKSLSLFQLFLDSPALLSLPLTTDKAGSGFAADATPFLEKKEKVVEEDAGIS